jgi:hypothetical protein
MKKLMMCICVTLVCAVTPAPSQGFSRFLFHRPIFHNHGVQPLLNVLPTMPAPAIGNIFSNPANSLQGAPPSNSQIMVDSAVQSNITTAKQNLDSASTIINDLLKTKGSGSQPATPGVTLPIVKGIPVPAKTGGKLR